MLKNYIQSPIFYMGNKYRLLPKIEPLFPTNIKNFYDLFGGSGCVSANVEAENIYYNELNDNIVNLHKMFLEFDADYINNAIMDYIKRYELNTPGTDIRQNVPEVEAVRDDYNEKYLNFREAYNKSDKPILMLYALTFYSFSNLIRFNSKNEFNMPYGNRCYTSEHKKIIDLWCNTIKNKNIIISNKDAFDILENTEFTKDDFIYDDPPYSQTMAIYNEQRAFGGWGIEDDYKLFDYLEKLNAKGVKWGLSNVFKNKDFTNQHLIDWCEKNNWTVRHLDFTYSSLGKGNAHSDEVYICNYIPPIPEFKQTKLF